MTYYMVENLTGRQVLIRLNSGQTLFLEPGGRSGEIPAEEMSDNTMVDKLLNRHIIATQPVTPGENTPAISTEGKKIPHSKPDRGPAPEIMPMPGTSPDTWWDEPDTVTKPKKQSKSKSKGEK